MWPVCFALLAIFVEDLPEVKAHVETQLSRAHSETEVADFIESLKSLEADYHFNIYEDQLKAACDLERTRIFVMKKQGERRISRNMMVYISGTRLLGVDWLTNHPKGHTEKVEIYRQPLLYEAYRTCWQEFAAAESKRYPELPPLQVQGLWAQSSFLALNSYKPIKRKIPAALVAKISAGPDETVSSSLVYGGGCGVTGMPTRGARLQKPLKAEGNRLALRYLLRHADPVVALFAAKALLGNSREKNDTHSQDEAIIEKLNKVTR